MRYLDTRSVPIDSLQPYPGNARTHDEAALAESAEANGQYRSVVVRQLADGELQILAGHGTTDAFRLRGDEEIRVEVIEADDTEARRILLADNGSSRNAGYNDAALLELLDAASTDGGLLGTGWDGDTYRNLLDKAHEPFREEPLAPDDFASYDDETIETEHECPKCGYQWSGKSS